MYCSKYFCLYPNMSEYLFDYRNMEQKKIQKPSAAYFYSPTGSVNRGITTNKNFEFEWAEPFPWTFFFFLFTHSKYC